MSRWQHLHMISTPLVLVSCMLCVLLPTSLSGQTVGNEARRLVNWMDQYMDLPQAPNEQELPLFVPGWFEGLEIRSTTDEFNFGQQRYTLRGEPKLPHVRRAERRLQNAQRNGLRSVGEDVLADGRADALKLLFEMITNLREAELVDTLYHVQSRLVDITRMRVVEPGYDIERVLDAEDELADIKIRLNELKALSREIKSPVLPRDLVGLENIKFRLAALASEGPAKTATQTAALEQLDAEMALERAENLSFLKFLQVRYRGSMDSDDLMREQLSVGGSISFPRRERHIRQLDKMKVERLEEVYDYQLKEREREREFKDAIVDLQRMLAGYEDLKVKAIEYRRRRDRLSKSYIQHAQSRPESLLRLSRRNLNDRVDIVKMEGQIRKAYAALLGKFVTLDAAGIQRWVLK